MGSLWNTRPGDERAESPRSRNDDGNEGAPRIVVEREPDEHTRLLPQPSTRDGYLSPDDPAVRLGILDVGITQLMSSSRSHHTTSGVCVSCATSQFFSWYDPGPRYYPIY